MRRNTAIRHLATLFEEGSSAGLTDGQLLERAVTRSGEASEIAFAALIERHGPMVLAVCRSVMRNPHDAQDAFQVTFLVLIRKARSLWVKDSIGPWLHGVAYRVAVHAQSTSARRRRLERRAAELMSEAVRESRRDEIAAAIHEEVEELPDRHRLPIVLCDLGGQTHDQAARVLGVPVGTVKSRLVRGRERLRGRLLRRGIAPTAAAWAAWASREARAEVPVALAEWTARAASSAGSGSAAGVGTFSLTVAKLTEEALRVMTVTKLKVAGSFGAALALFVAGASVIGQTGGGRSGNTAATAPATTTPPAADAVEADASDLAPTLAQDRVQFERPIADGSDRTRELLARIRELEAALERARRELAQSETRTARDGKGAQDRDPNAIQRPRPPSPTAGGERRHEDIERKLDLLLSDRERARSQGGFNVPASPPPPQDEEDRVKADAWAVLMRDGFIGRFDNGSMNSLQLYTQLYRRYVGRRPSADEAGILFSMFGPGHEQVTLAPEEFIRRLFDTKAFPTSALGRALFREPTTPASR